MTGLSVGFLHLFKISLNSCHGNGHFWAKLRFFGDKVLKIYIFIDYSYIHMKYLDRIWSNLG